MKTREVEKLQIYQKESGRKNNSVKDDPIKREYKIKSKLKILLTKRKQTSKR